MKLTVINIKYLKDVYHQIVQYFNKILYNIWNFNQGTGYLNVLKSYFFWSKCIVCMQVI